MDWGKTENIITAAVLGGLILLLLVAEIIVIAKGKRVCAIPDVLLRIFSVVTLIVGAALFTCSVLIQLDGPFRIDILQSAQETDSAQQALVTLVIGEKSIELPFAALFVTLSYQLGSNLALVLTVMSLVALITDCLIANKKADKKSADKKPTAKRMTPEELKRAAEIERIRRIGNSAVKKTSTAASSDTAKTAKTSAAKQAEEPDRPREEKPSVNEETVLTPSDDALIDWRTETPRSTTFIGINENTDASFDTFDDIDEPSSATDEQIGFDEDEVKPADGEENNGGENYGHASASSDGSIYDDQYGLDGRIDNADATESYGGEAQESGKEDSAPNFTMLDDEDDYLQPDEFDDVVSSEDTATELERDGAYASDGIMDDDGFTPDMSDADDREIYGEEDFEPNRNIYIPKIRTIVRTSRQPEKPKKASAKKKTAATPKTRKKRAPAAPSEETVTAQKPKTNKTAPTATQNAVENNNDVKPVSQRGKSVKSKKAEATSAAPKREEPSVTASDNRSDRASDGKADSAAPEKAQRRTKKNEPVMTIPRVDTGKKLPVTRRYVILDRTSAVNIFNDYLKERGRAEKDNLESNINTIILK